MKKVLIVVGAALAVAVVPAAAGFAGNSALSRQVEVHTGPTAGPIHKVGQPGDDKGGLRPTPSASDRRHDANDDRGGARTPGYGSEYGDDKGGLRPRDERTEKGDDRRGGSGRGRGGSDDGAGHR